ncbi:MAG: ATP-binding protein, partial [Muribaculaceae bacterium]|nr:ATP-binding protein [Muribaculaceae bacterium]
PYKNSRPISGRLTFLVYLLSRTVVLLTYKGAVFFIEEPEQNLFPESQAKLLYHLVGAIKCANSNSEEQHSMITIATHSPYILSALNVLMAASEAYEINPEATKSVISEKYILKKGSVAAYYVKQD